jgi:transcriptional regulator with XRE-family HTH domain
MGQAHEGERVRAAVREAGATLAELARLAGVTDQAAQRWVHAPVMGAAARQTVDRGLRGLGIDPARVWVTGSGQPVAEAVDRRRLLDRLDADGLRDLLSLLRASDRERDVVSGVIADRLSDGRGGFSTKG